MNKEAQAPDCGEVSGLLRAWSQGDQEALKKLTPIVYEELQNHLRTDHALGRNVRSHENRLPVQFDVPHQPHAPVRHCMISLARNHLGGGILLLV